MPMDDLSEAYGGFTVVTVLAGVCSGGVNKVHSGELGISPNTGWTRQTRAEGVGLRARVLSGAHTPRSKQASKETYRGVPGKPV